MNMLGFPVMMMLTCISVLEKIYSYGIILNSGSKCCHNLFKNISRITSTMFKNIIVSIIPYSSGL